MKGTIQIKADTLYKGKFVPPTIPKALSTEILSTATTSVEFSFNNAKRKQIDGVVMGSPLGPILANMFVGYYEQELLRQTRKLVLYLRYVYNTISIFNKEIHSDSFLVAITSLHPCLIFIFEIEIDGKFFFLS